MKEVVIGTRASDLAMWQAQHVATLLRETHPGLTVRVEKISSKGDRVRDVPLAKIGGKGLFTKELEVALLEEEIDLAVHSLKDLPTELPQGLCLACVPEREVPSDAFISRTGVKLLDLPQGARVGTSSLRRQALLRAARPDLEILDIRGNVPTRLKKMKSGEYDAIILAMAGVIRLGLEHEVTEAMTPDIMLPAVGQGALGIEVRENDTSLRELLAPLTDDITWNAVAAERALLSGLGGGCQTPLGAWARMEGDSLYLEACVCTLDGRELIRTEQRGLLAEAQELGMAAAKALVAQGAGRFLVGMVDDNVPHDDALAGKRIVVTRPREQANKLTEALEARGAEVMTFPTIAIQGVPFDVDAVAGACDWIIFTSVNGVKHFVAGLTAANKAPADFRDCSVCAVGPATAKAAQEAGFVVSLTPPEYVAESVLDVMRKTEGVLTGKRVVMPRGNRARPDLPEGLRASGAVVDEVVVYETVAVTPDPDDLTDLLHARPHLVTFTSASTVDSFVQAVGDPGREELADTAYAVIGPITQAAADKHGIRVSVAPEQYDIPGLVAAVVDHYADPKDPIKEQA